MSSIGSFLSDALSGARGTYRSRGLKFSGRISFIGNSLDWVDMEVHQISSKHFGRFNFTVGHRPKKLLIRTSIIKLSGVPRDLARCYEVSLQKFKSVKCIGREDFRPMRKARLNNELLINPF